MIRSGKVGRKLYVEVDFVVPGSEWNVAEEDAVRRAVVAALEPLGLDVWATAGGSTAGAGLAGVLLGLALGALRSAGGVPFYAAGGFLVGAGTAGIVRGGVAGSGAFRSGGLAC
ncbi:hypothetical protein ARTHRO9V_10157 [Arthrobacter sp. 9V]|nr:hypothetical protein ARTHRO9V_10157 [Arthrobacter sp. 9V]